MNSSKGANGLSFPVNQETGAILAGARPRILLVDDESNVLNALRRELKGTYDIEKFTDPTEALHCCREVTFDLVISDYKMPVMDGIAFLTEFGKLQPDAARLILSGQADINALASAINETHIYRFLSKPWNSSELQSSIAQALAFRSIILENRRLADIYRLTHAPLKPREIKKLYRIILVDGNNVSLTVIRRGLIQDANYGGVRGAMRGEIGHGSTFTASDFEFVVDTFNTAQIALKHASNHDFDLVIAAQVLPDMEGIQLLGELQKIRPDAARILISDEPDKTVLSQAINELQISGFICLHQNSSELGNSTGVQLWDIYQIRTAVIQALTSRELLLENQRLAGLLKQG